MDLELLIVCTPQVPLVYELLEEGRALIESLQVLDHTDLLTTVHLLVVLEQLLDDALEDGLLVLVN